MGIVAVAAFAASAAGVLPGATITFTRRRTKSAAKTGNRSFWPSAQRKSIVTLRPSTKPVSLRPWRKERKGPAYKSADELPRKPITGIVCCAVAISGHAAATPKSVTNARRLIVAPEAKLRVS